jgi:uncharacterized membrane protein
MTEESERAQALEQLSEVNNRWTKHLQWNSETQNALYYAFWILFAGGLVYSLKMTDAHFPSIWWWLLFSFRALAVIGTALTFFMQDQALDGVGFAEMTLRKDGLERIGIRLSSDDECFLAHTAKSSARARSSEIWLQIIAGVFLILAILLSFGPADQSTHHFERFGNTMYVLDTSTGMVCDPLNADETTNPIDRALAAKDANGFPIMRPAPPPQPPACSK